MKSLRKTVQFGSNLLFKEVCCTSTARNGLPPLLTAPPVRYQTGYSHKGGGYFGSKLVDEKNPDIYTKFEKSYEEYKFVEKLIPPTHVPKPPADPNVELPSGWKPQRLTRETCPYPYFIPRTKNHMMPIYLRVPDAHRGLQRRTVIKFIEGNIWALEKEIAAHLQALYPTKVITSWVNECWRQIFIRGDYVNDTMEWALKQGF